MSLTVAKKKIDYVRTMRGNDGRTLFLELITEFREKRSEISRNPYFSEKGKGKQIEKLSATYERKFLELAAQFQESGRKVAIEAKQIAEDFLIGEFPEVDARKRALWTRKVEELEATIKFAVIPKRALEALQELVETTDKPAPAHEIKSKILTLSDQVINNANPQERAQMRLEIGKLYNQATK